MSLTYSTDFETQPIIDCILGAIEDGLENTLRVFTNIDRTSPFEYAITCDTGTLWINDYEANAYGFNNEHEIIVDTLISCGVDVKFIW